MTEEERQMERDKILPIDRGWAWIIVVASSGLFAIHAGGFKCSGITLLELTEQYEGVYSPSLLIWVMTIKYMLGGLCGPLVSLLIVRFGHRNVAMTGVLLMTISYIGLAYSFNLVTLLLFHSIPGGFGNMMAGLTALLVTGQYFKKRKALALGLTASGSGLGTFVIPYILRPLFDNLDFSGASLLYGGFLLQFVCLAALLRPISFYERLHARELAMLDSRDLMSDNNHNIHVHDTRVSELSNTDQQETEETIKQLLVSHDVRHRSASFNHTKRRSSLQTTTFKSESTLNHTSHSTTDHNHLTTPKTDPKNVHLLSLAAISGGSVYFVQQAEEDGHVTISKSKTVQFKGDNFQWKVLFMPKFLMVCLSLFVYAMGTAVVYQSVPALGKETGITKNWIAAAMMLAGGLEIPCRIVNGHLADKGFMSATNQYTLCLLIAGLMTLLCALLSGLPGIACVLIGMSSVGTSIFSLVPIVLKELIGVENITSGMGLQLPFQSLGFIVASYAAGAVFEASQSWRVVFFYISGVMILGSCVTWPYCISLLCDKRRQSQHKTTQLNHEETNLNSDLIT